MLASGIRNILFPKNNRIAAVILLLVYAYLCGSHLVEAEGSGINLFEYLLCCITDHYYLMYALLFYLVIDSAIRIKGTLGIARIRFRTLRRYYGTLIIIRVASLFVLVVAHLLIPLIVGIPRLEIDFGYNITLIGGQFNSNYEVLYTLSELIPNSALATVCVTTFLYFGILFICVISAFIFEIAGQKGFAISVAFILINSFIGFVTNLNEGFFKYLFLNDYFIFHHGMVNDNLWCFAVYALIMVLVIFSLLKIAFRHNSNRVTLHRKYTRNLYFHPIMTGVFYLVYCGLAFAISINGREPFAWNILKGFSYYQFNVIELLFYIAPIMYSLFFVNMEWENEIKERNLLALIRFEKKEKWEKEKALSEIGFISTNIITVAAVSFLSVAFSSNNLNSTIQELSEFYNVNVEMIIIYGILSVMFRCIEWILFYVIDKTVFKVSGTTIASYLVTIAFIFFGFVLPTFNPIGKGSLYQLLEIGSKGIWSSVFMVVPEMLVLVVLFIINKHIKEKGYHGISNQI